MNIFLDLLNQHKEFESDFDDGEKLHKFFGTLAQFNGQQAIEKDFMEKIEDYFDYRWTHYKNGALLEEADLAIFNELPYRQKKGILVYYLYDGFLNSFHHFFSIPNRMYPLKTRSFFTWS